MSRTALPVIRTTGEMYQKSIEEHALGHLVALVPTMGHLHEGHLSLIAEARKRCDCVVVSIFVNPTQFGPGEDFDQYPRSEAEDLVKCAAAGATLAFCPSANEMYPEGFETTVKVGRLSEPLCGAHRPGHFDGVATIVTKLFNVAQPNLAIFGQKDFQQLTIIKRVALDLSFPIEIIGMPIVREKSGLAMSSRNQYLSPAGRERAASLYRGLSRAESLFDEGVRDSVALIEAVRRETSSADVAVEYLELRDATTLELATTANKLCVLAIAARVENTRLIDNVVLSETPI